MTRIERFAFAAVLMIAAVLLVLGAIVEVTR